MGRIDSDRADANAPSGSTTSLGLCPGPSSGSSSRRNHEWHYALRGAATVASAHDSSFAADTLCSSSCVKPLAAYSYEDGSADRSTGADEPGETIYRLSRL